MKCDYKEDGNGPCGCRGRARSNGLKYKKGNLGWIMEIILKLINEHVT